MSSRRRVTAGGAPGSARIGTTVLLLLALPSAGVQAAGPAFAPDRPLRPTFAPRGCTLPSASWSVVAGAAGGDGTASAPFGSVAAALHAAERARACRVALRVGEGHYPGDLNITRPTTIDGAARPGASPILEGAVRNGGGHPLVLRSLRIAGAMGTGLAQAGGDLELVEVSIVGTHATPGDPASGTGLRLTGGVRARLTTVVLGGHAARALWAEGPATVVTWSDVLVERNRSHPAQAGPTGDRLAAVEVCEGARLFADKAVIRENEAIGLHVRGNARAHLRHVQVAGTAAIAVGGETRYGANVVVSDGAVLELRGFLVRGAATVGIAVLDGFLTAEDGVVEANAVGLHVRAAYAGGLAWERCIAGSVAFERNGVDASGLLALPAQEPGAPGATPSMSGCARVPWE